jgi:hypothetical protein
LNTVVGRLIEDFDQTAIVGVDALRFEDQIDLQSSRVNVGKGHKGFLVRAE